MSANDTNTARTHGGAEFPLGVYVLPQNPVEVLATFNEATGQWEETAAGDDIMRNGHSRYWNMGPKIIHIYDQDVLDIGWTVIRIHGRGNNLDNYSLDNCALRGAAGCTEVCNPTAILISDIISNSGDEIHTYVKFDSIPNN